MHKIALVCSVHRENGLCNPRELLNILRAIEPEVIFLELRPSDVAYYYKRGSLEANAITMFREFKSFQTVPVDGYDMPTNLLLELKRDFDSVLDCVTQMNQEYELLNQANDNSVHRDGFNYLNSVDCETMMARIAEVEENTIVGTSNHDLISALERWRSFHQRRELEMMRNIYVYCKENAFATGIFLVGAAHKSGIVRTIERHGASSANPIDWNFAYAGAPP